jgi:hypothetical protein
VSIPKEQSPRRVCAIAARKARSLNKPIDMPLITYQTKNHGSFSSNSEPLTWWLIEEVRAKVFQKQQQLVATEHVLPAVSASGKALAPVVVNITVNSGADLTELVARYQVNPYRVFTLTFPHCNNETIQLGGVIHPAKLKPVEPASPYTFFGGTYQKILEHLEQYMDEVDGATSEFFQAIIKAFKGKQTDLITLQDPSKALSFFVTMAGSEGARNFGMLAASMMALDLLKHHHDTIYDMFSPPSAQWPGVGHTEALLREIDDSSYSRAQGTTVPLSTAAQGVFDKLNTLLARYVDAAFERDRSGHRKWKSSPHPPTKTKQAKNIRSNTDLEAAAKGLLTRKVLSHI